MLRELWEEEFGVYAVALCFFFSLVCKCSLKFTLLSKNILKCFWRGVCGTIFWLKNKGGWLIICTLQEKNQFLSLLSRIRIDVHFPLECLFPIFFKERKKFLQDLTYFLCDNISCHKTGFLRKTWVWFFLLKRYFQR